MKQEKQEIKVYRAFELDLDFEEKKFMTDHRSAYDVRAEVEARMNRFINGAISAEIVQLPYFLRYDRENGGMTFKSHDEINKFLSRHGRRGATLQELLSAIPQIKLQKEFYCIHATNALRESYDGRVDNFNLLFSGSHDLPVLRLNLARFNCSRDGGHDEQCDCSDLFFLAIKEK